MLGAVTEPQQPFVCYLRSSSNRCRRRRALLTDCAGGADDAYGRDWAAQRQDAVLGGGLDLLGVFAVAGYVARYGAALSRGDRVDACCLRWVKFKKK